MAAAPRAPRTGAPRTDRRASADVRDRPGRLSVGVVGCGRVGSALGAALERAGHRVVAASGQSAASRRRREALLPHVRAFYGGYYDADAHEPFYRQSSRL